MQKHKKSQIKADIIVEEVDEDKRLITGTVLSGDYTTGHSLRSGNYSIGQTIIFGKYALFPLTLQGEEFFFLHEDDVIGECDYKEV